LITKLQNQISIRWKIIYNIWNTYNYTKNLILKMKD
jgi:hypothetical protein